METVEILDRNIGEHCNRKKRLLTEEPLKR